MSTNWDFSALKRMILYIEWTTEAGVLPDTPIPRPIWRKSFARSKGIASSSDIESPRLEDHSITTPLRIRGNGLSSFVLNLSADDYGATELAMNTVTNSQLWHRRLGRLSEKTLELIQRRGCNGILFDGTVSDCDVCAVGKSLQLTHLKKVKNADVKAPF